MRLIDADALLERWCSEVCKPKPNCNEDCMIYDYLTMNFLSPTIEPVKHGRWEPVTNGRGGYECSICHSYAPSYKNGEEQISPYCPNCGAKMEGEEK